MKKIVYNVNSGAPLKLGYQGDYNYIHVEFQGFLMVDPVNVVYLKCKGYDRYPLLGMGLDVNLPFMSKFGSIQAQLVETDENDELVHNSPVFDIRIEQSIEADEIGYPEPPGMATWFDAMGKLYNTVEYKLENGEFVGERGEKGDEGPQGPQGLKGEKGDTGDRGLRGEKGDTGERGEKGEKGDPGYTPVKGVDYFDGKDGKDGEKGEKGDTGPKGSQGEKGDRGYTGPQGPPGVPGVKGDKGNDAEVTFDSVTSALGYQPVDKDFVNSSIATNTANFIGTFSNLASLKAYSGTLTNNDYGFVTSKDESGNTLYSRYKYNSTTKAWTYEYALNNSSYTAEQWASIQSGITKALVTKLEQLYSKDETATKSEVNELKQRLSALEATINGTL